MEELLIVLFQFFFELAINGNVFSLLPFDLLSKKRTTPERDSVWKFVLPLCLVWSFLGTVVGSLSLIVFTYTFLQNSGLRIVNLLVSPLLSGVLAQILARHRAKLNPLLIPRNHFWYGFSFSLGITSVRFVYALRA